MLSRSVQRAGREKRARKDGVRGPDLSILRTQTAQFWAGVFADESQFAEFVGEDPDYYAEENEDGDLPLSPFAGSQNERRYDHDFMEVGYCAAPDGDIAGTFKGNSYIENWAQEFARRLHDAGIEHCNAFIMVAIDQQRDGTLYRHIKEPRSVEDYGFRLVYLGEISYPI